MLNDRFIQMIKTDKELNELRKKIYAITGREVDISYSLTRMPSIETWKKELRENLKELEAHSGGV